ncbi:MAG: heme o synthase, partial [Candidatus Heimdallarchaeota archaeon]
MIRAYLELLKLKQTGLLVWTAFAAYLIAANRELEVSVLGLLTGSIFLAVSGTTATSMYFDSNIDVLMDRTKNRPIPSKRIAPWRALVFGLALLGLGLFLALFLNWLVILIIITGAIFNIVVYTLILKKRTPLSILFGGIAGGMPTLAGWTAYVEKIELSGILLALMILVWIPTHVLNLALFHVHDYEKANVPMFPVVVGQKKTREVILLANIVLTVLAFSFYVLGIFGRTYL